MSATQPQCVNVDLGERSYPIYVGRGLLHRGDLLRPHIRASQVAVVSNDVVAPLYLATLRTALGVGYEVDVFLMADGEQNKSLASYGELMDFLLERRHNRTTTVIALGGGVVGISPGLQRRRFSVASTSSRFRPPCSRRWIPRWEARPRSTIRAART